jgi:hypothetical protein
VNGVLFGAYGVGVEGGAYGDIQRNTVRGVYDPLYVVWPYLGNGIWLADAHEASRVRGNTVYGVGTGITLGPAALGAAASILPIGGGYEVFNNQLTDNGIGLMVYSGLNDIHHNHSHLSRWGIAVDGTDNTIWMNDARYNIERDCLDSTTGLGTEDTANWWTDNLGTSNSLPPGICSVPFH